MTYAPLDDRFGDHPKHLELSLAELGLLACAIAYATRSLTDGVIPRTWPRKKWGRSGARLAARLVTVWHLWSIRQDGDYEIVGFLDHNPSKAEVLAKRAARADAGRKGGEQSAASKRQANAQAIAQAPRQPTSLHSTPLEEREREISTRLAVLSTGVGAPVESVTPLADESHRERAREQLTKLAEWAKANGVER